MSSEGLVSDIWAALWGKAKETVFDPRARLLGGETPIVTPPENDPYARDYEQILSIQQKGARGFRTYDINPFDITIDEFPCQIQNQVLGELFGFEDGYASNGFPTDSQTAPFWRTIPIEANATWVKVEYLPTRINDGLGRGFGSNLGIGPNIQPQNLGPVIPDPPTPYDEVEPWPQGYISLGAQIILQFDDQAGSPIIAKHGDTFKIPFNVLYVSFKQWSPRIRITVGYNCEMEHNDDRLLMTRPAFAGGRGFLNNPTQHFVPFSITVSDLVGTVNRSIVIGAADNGPYTLITNPAPAALIATNPRNFLAKGIGLVFISEVTFSFVPTAAGLGGIAILGLFIEENQPAPAADRRIRRVCEIPIAYANSSAGTVHKSFNEPIRVGLRSNQKLTVRIFFPAGGTVSFGVEGYSYGLLVGSMNPAGTLPLGPFNVQSNISEDAYAMDYLSLNNAGGED